MLSTAVLATILPLAIITIAVRSSLDTIPILLIVLEFTIIPIKKIKNQYSDRSQLINSNNSPYLAPLAELYTPLTIAFSRKEPVKTSPLSKLNEKKIRLGDATMEKPVKNITLNSFFQCGSQRTGTGRRMSIPIGALAVPVSSSVFLSFVSTSHGSVEVRANQTRGLMTSDDVV